MAITSMAESTENPGRKGRQEGGKGSGLAIDHGTAGVISALASCSAHHYANEMCVLSAY